MEDFDRKEDARYLLVQNAIRDIPALLALVDAQAARIDKALELHPNNRDHECTYRTTDGLLVHGFNVSRGRSCDTRRALTEDPQ